MKTSTSKNINGHAIEKLLADYAAQNYGCVNEIPHDLNNGPLMDRMGY
jgi:hypothetical protein